VHLSIDGWRIKTVPSRLSAVDLARLRNAGARPAGPPPAGPAPGALAETTCVEVQRLVNASGIITLGNQQVARQRIQVGLRHARQTVTIELSETALRVIDQHGELITTVPRNGTGEISRFKAYGIRTRQLG
jgi:hypothetical protein